MTFWSRPPYPRLHWHDLETYGAPYHAALFTTQSAAGADISAHRHDFHELMFVTTGTGEHHLYSENRFETTPLTAGTLIFLRPGDCHAITGLPGRRLYWINIAFSAAAWEAFRRLAHLPSSEWDNAAHPPNGVLPPGSARTACEAAFEAALQRFHARRLFAPPTETPEAVGWLDFSQFLAEVLRPLLPAPAMPGETLEGPPWLIRACRTMAQHPAYCAEGVERLTALSGVSYAHLARSLKAAAGQTPTQYVNALRLSQAALLLTTTTRPILDISDSCGFMQISYFYRLFRARFGCAPDAYRRQAGGYRTGLSGNTSRNHAPEP